MVECTGGAAFVLCAAFYGIGKTGIISLRGLVVFLFLAVLTAVAVIDWDTRIIYDRFHLLIGILGAAAIWLFPEISLISRLIGLLIISVPMLVLAMAIPGAFGGGGYQADGGLRMAAWLESQCIRHVCRTSDSRALLRRHAGKKEVRAEGPFRLRSLSGDRTGNSRFLR